MVSFCDLFIYFLYFDVDAEDPSSGILSKSVHMYLSY